MQIENWSLADRIAHHLIRALALLFCLALGLVTVCGATVTFIYGIWELIQWGKDGFSALRSGWANGLLHLVPFAAVTFVVLLLALGVGRVALELALKNIVQFEFSEWRREWFEIRSDEVPYGLDIRIHGLAFIIYLITGTLRSLLFTVAFGSVWIILHSRHEPVSVCLGALGLLISVGIMWADAKASQGKQ